MPGMNPATPTARKTEPTTRAAFCTGVRAAVPRLEGVVDTSVLSWEWLNGLWETHVMRCVRLPRTQWIGEMSDSLGSTAGRIGNGPAGDSSSQTVVSVRGR